MPFPVHALDSRPLGSGLIRENTAPLGMVTQGVHKERISLFLIDSPAFTVVLRLPWLAPLFLGMGGLSRGGRKSAREVFRGFRW